MSGNSAAQDAATQVALRQIFDRLGNIDGRLAAGARRHDEFAFNLATIDEKVDAFAGRIITVEANVARIPVIEKAVWKHEESRIEAQGAKKQVEGVKKRVGGLFRLGHLIWAAIATFLTAIGFHWWPWPR